METINGGFSPACAGCQAAAELYRSSFPLCRLYQMAELGVFLPELVGLCQGPSPLLQPLWPNFKYLRVPLFLGLLLSWPQGSPSPLRCNYVPQAPAV